jgi:hypothetical protein
MKQPLEELLVSDHSRAHQLVGALVWNVREMMPTP